METNMESIRKQLKADYVLDGKNCRLFWSYDHWEVITWDFNGKLITLYTDNNWHKALTMFLNQMLIL